MIVPYSLSIVSNLIFKTNHKIKSNNGANGTNISASLCARTLALQDQVPCWLQGETGYTTGLHRCEWAKPPRS